MNDSDAIAELSQRWAAYWSAKDVDGLAALYSLEAAFLTATGKRIQGRTAIRKLFEETFAVYASTIAVQGRRAQARDDLGYASGEYTERRGDEPGQPVGSGSYVVVCCRGEDRQWRILEHLWTFAPASGDGP